MYKLKYNVLICKNVLIIGQCTEYSMRDADLGHFALQGKKYYITMADSI